MVGDDALIDEITGLVESPFCIMGQVDEKFQALPPHVIQSTMRTHQKFLSVENNRQEIVGFITVANKYKPSKSAQETILAGNQRVLSARLADTKFFWENDWDEVDNGMSNWRDSLDKMIFHNKLGTQGERVNRIAKFARTHADLFGVKPDEAEAVAKVMKLDLCSQMVGEYPELQGLMGFCYVKHVNYQGGSTRAIYEHHMSIGLLGVTPTEPMSIAMAMSDKLDTLAGFWSVELTPTSSKDPFALRRAALGVIRLILDNNLRLSLTELLDSAFKPFPKKDPEAQTKLMDFFHERLKIYLRDKHDIPADTIDACRFGQGETDFALLTNRAKALHAFRP
ncbi:MAG: glycine--tRNA ligase subunit beta, partial [Proteobacteria bacterium]|nr:glycine--tRNA ligase subunit beta [Pseudomonadota bacterium]